MTKIWKNSLTSIIVLATVSFVSVVFVLLLNDLLPAKSNFFNKNKLQSICPASDYSMISDNDLAAKDINLAAFNSQFSNSAVRAVFVAMGGENDGKYIIEAQGDGYGDRYPIILYFSYNGEGEITGVIDINVDKGNTFWNNLKPYLNEIYAGLIGKSGDIGGGVQLLNTKTGATQSMNGIARAANIANKLILELLGQNSEQPYEVTNADLLSKLREITSQMTTFTGYNYKIMEKIGAYSSEVIAVYVSDSGDVIFETKGDAGGYGRAVLLVLVDTNDHAVIKINPRSLSTRDDKDQGVLSEFLSDREVLTEIFAGLNIEGINNLGKYLQGSTGATQTANGIKTAVIAALKNIDGFMVTLEQAEGDTDE